MMLMLTALAGLGLAVLVTGLLLAWVLPHGSGRRGVSLLGLGRHDWADIHLWLALAMTVGVVVHVLMHWTWAHQTAARLLGARSDPLGAGRWWSLAAIGGGALLVLAGVMAAGLAWTSG